MQTAIRTLARVAPSRGLTTSLFAHPLEQLSLVDLRQEARRRGLSPSGNKATLITRIQHVANRAEDSTATARNDASGRRLATTAAAAAPQRSPRPTLDVKLPDLSPPQDVEGPHIPFLPDSWDSSRVRAPDAIHHSPAADSPLPKVLVVAGTQASTPTYNVSHQTESEEDHHTPETANNMGNTGLLGDIATDLGLPRKSDITASLTKTRDAVLAMAQQIVVQDRTETRSSSQSRPLDADEARGLWVLLAVLGGSWLAGGFLRPSEKNQPEHHAR